MRAEGAWCEGVAASWVMEATAAATEAAVRYPWPREEEEEAADEEAMARLKVKSKKKHYIQQAGGMSQTMFMGVAKNPTFIGVKKPTQETHSFGPYSGP